MISLDSAGSIRPISRSMWCKTTSETAQEWIPIAPQRRLRDKTAVSLPGADTGVCIELRWNAMGSVNAATGEATTVSSPGTIIFPHSALSHGVTFISYHSEEPSFAEAFSCSTETLLTVSSQTDAILDMRVPLSASREEKALRLELVTRVAEIFEDAKEELFEDGMESDFEEKLTKLIVQYERNALAVLRSLLFLRSVSFEAGAEALRIVGHLDHPYTHSERLKLLEECLTHSRFEIRDGAVIGLALLDNPSAIPYVRNAIQAEASQSLREDMAHLLLQLQETLDALFPKKD